MKYDDASWHSEGDFPADLPAEAGATHSGMLLAWALLHDLGGEIHRGEAADALADLQARRITPGHYFLEQSDGKLIEDDFNETGNAFAQAYFNIDKGLYLTDYEELLGKGLQSLYHVEDSWQNYDLLCPRLDQRFADWRHPPSLKAKIKRLFGAE